MCMVLRTITATPFQLLPFIKSLIIDGRINSVNIDTKKGMLLEIGRKTRFENHKNTKISHSENYFRLIFFLSDDHRCLFDYKWLSL